MTKKEVDEAKDNDRETTPVIEQPKARPIGSVNVSERGRPGPGVDPSRPFDVSPSAFESVTMRPNVATFPNGVYNDPSAGCLQFLCVANAQTIRPDDHRELMIGALYIVGNGEINVLHEDETAQGGRAPIIRKHLVRMGNVFRVTTKFGPVPIMRLMRESPPSEGPSLGPPAQVVALPCGVVSAVSRSSKDKSVHHTLRRLDGAGLLFCPRCRSKELKSWSQPEEEETERNMLFIPPGTKTDFSPGYVQDIKARESGVQA